MRKISATEISQDLSSTTEVHQRIGLRKRTGLFCGGDLVKLIFRKIDPKVDIQLLIEDGQKFEKNQRLLELKGSSSSLVAGERVSLNVAMHLSGIATSTALLVTKLSGSKVKLADTRKTTPGIRVFEKYAFHCGGGINHRLGLDDAAMLKENHIEWSQGISESIKILKNTIPWTKKNNSRSRNSLPSERSCKSRC